MSLIRRMGWRFLIRTRHVTNETELLDALRRGDVFWW